MKKLKSNFINMILVLSGITFFAALALSTVYSITKEPIERAKIERQQNAIRTVLPPFDHLGQKPIEMIEGLETIKVYKAYDKNNQFVGAAVESSSNNGYNGHIEIIVGFNKDGIILNYFILDQKETPGLGAKVVNWFKSDNSRQSIIGRNPAIANLSVNKDGGEVDGITAATISSRAFLFAVRNAYFAFVSNLEVKKTVIEHKIDSTQLVLNDSISSINKVVKGQAQ